MAYPQNWLQRRLWHRVWSSASNRERLRIVWSDHRGLVIGAGVALAAGLFLWLGDELASPGSWLLEHAEEVRNLMLSAGVVGAGVGVWVAFRRSQTERLRQVTDSFGSAVQLLGHEDRGVRIGAIYALERIAKQNRDEHSPIMETLTAYIRDRSDQGQEVAPVDLQAAANVLARRRTDHERRGLEDHLVPRSLNLRGAVLAGTRFEPGGNLAHADMSDVDLSHAEMRGLDLTQVHLMRARLSGAALDNSKMGHAFLIGADLRGADLYDVDLRDATLYRADLNGANLRGAKMYNAKLGLLPVASIRDLERDEDAGADLSTALNLTQEQLDAAFGDETTKIPEGLKRPAHWSM